MYAALFELRNTFVCFLLKSFSFDKDVQILGLILKTKERKDTLSNVILSNRIEVFILKYSY